MKQRPIHQHDCNNCVFLGTFQNNDLYYCNQHGRPTVIARYGPSGEYASGLTFGEHDKDDLTSELGEAYRRAKKLNLI